MCKVTPESQFHRLKGKKKKHDFPPRPQPPFHTGGGPRKSTWDIGDAGLLAYPGASPLRWQVTQSPQTSLPQSPRYPSSHSNGGQQIWPDLIVDVTSHLSRVIKDRKGRWEERGLLHNGLVVAPGGHDKLEQTRMFMCSWPDTRDSHLLFRRWWPASPTEDD